MASFFQVIEFMIVCGSILALAMMILVNMPQSPLRSLLIQVFGWLFALFCGAYAISPIDVMPEILLGPFGLMDDLGAVVVGFMSARAAWNAGKDRVRLKLQEEQQEAA